MLLRVLILVITVLITVNASANEKARLIKETRLLKTELSLAQKPLIYFVFNLKENKVQIRAKGFILKEFLIHNVRYWGSSLPGNVLVLKKKSTFLKPRRDKINPGENKEDDIFEIEALELEDMPVRYTLKMDRGVYLSVMPTKGFFTTPVNVLSSFKKFLVRPFFKVLYSVRKKPFTAIDIVLNKEDAKALYWSLSEGTQTIIYPQ
ncbi:MAG: hypothetical protein A2Y66_01305 [Nitrospirae bacterium RBG_13_41_22]|nr:MAG: hypothetical protein A2Y66_01305 [Nitrospirae bacterium RBG_13_41_22]